MQETFPELVIFTHLIQVPKLFTEIAEENHDQESQATTSRVKVHICLRLLIANYQFA